MKKNTKLITFIKKTGIPIYLTLIAFLNLIENWSFWPIWRKIGLFILIPILFWVFWIEDGTQLLPWYKDGKKEKKIK